MGRGFFILFFIFTAFYLYCVCVCRGVGLGHALATPYRDEGRQAKREERSNQDTVATIKHRQHRRLAR